MLTNSQHKTKTCCTQTSWTNHETIWFSLSIIKKGIIGAARPSFSSSIVEIPVPANVTEKT